MRWQSRDAQSDLTLERGRHGGGGGGGGGLPESDKNKHVVHDRQAENDTLNVWQLMIQSGAKGSTSKLKPVLLVGGLQKIHGQQLRPAQDGRLAAHFGTRPCLHNQGFVASSFMRGVRIETNVFQSRAGQSQASDATNEVSSAGTNTRMLIRFLCDIRLSSDGTARDNDRQLIDFCYGHTGQLVHRERRVKLFNWAPAAQLIDTGRTDAVLTLEAATPLAVWLRWWSGDDPAYYSHLQRHWQVWQAWFQQRQALGTGWYQDGGDDDASGEEWTSIAGAIVTLPVWARLDFQVSGARGSAQSTDASRLALPTATVINQVDRLLLLLNTKVRQRGGIDLVVARLYLVLSLAPRRLWSLRWNLADLELVVNQLEAVWHLPPAAGENVGLSAAQCSSEVLTQATLQLKNQAFDFFTVGLLQGVPRFAQLLQHRVRHTDCCISLHLFPGTPETELTRFLTDQTTPWLRQTPGRVIRNIRRTTLTVETKLTFEVEWQVGPAAWARPRGLQCEVHLAASINMTQLVQCIDQKLPSNITWQLWRPVAPPTIPPPHTVTVQTDQPWILELGLKKVAANLSTPLANLPAGLWSCLTQTLTRLGPLLVRDSHISHLVWSGATTVALQADSLPTPLPPPPARARIIHLRLYRPPHLTKQVWVLMAMTDAWLQNLQTPSIHLMVNVYGIVMARLVLETELFKMLAQVKQIDRRHCRLIAHWMTFTGVVQNLRLPNLRRRCDDVFKQASFQQNADPLIMTPLVGAKERGRTEVGGMILGQPSGGGTGFFMRQYQGSKVISTPINY
jgi:hypothetical protein